MAAPSRSRWSLEALDVLERRGAMLWAVVLLVVVAGAITAFFLPGVVPPTPAVGVAVAVAGLLLGVAVVTAVDAGDALVRGPRHVRAAGGELVGVLPETVAPEAADELAAAVLDARPGRRLTLGVTGAQAATPTAAWAGALATALARRGASVLLVDLASGASPQDGILEVLEGDRPLARTVELDPELKLASIDAGRDLDAALRAAVLLPERLPRDLEVLLVALPAIAKGDVLDAAGALDTVLVLTASGKTRRARLQAAVAAIEAGGTAAQVVLIDRRLAAAAAAAPRSDADTQTPRTEPTPSAEDGAAEDGAAEDGAAETATGAAADRAGTPDGTGGSDDAAGPAVGGDAAGDTAADGDVGPTSGVDEVPPGTGPDHREDAVTPAGSGQAPARRDATTPSARTSPEGPGSPAAGSATPGEERTTPAVTDATHLRVASVDAADQDQPEVGAASPVDLSASPRSTVRLVRGVEPSPRRPLRPPPGTHEPAGRDRATPHASPPPTVEEASHEVDDEGRAEDQPGRAPQAADAADQPEHDAEPDLASDAAEEPEGDAEPELAADDDHPASSPDVAETSSAGDRASPVLGLRDPGHVRAARGVVALDAIVTAADGDEVEGPAPPSTEPDEVRASAEPHVDDLPEDREDRPDTATDETAVGDHEAPASPDEPAVGDEAPASPDEPFEGVDTGPVAGAEDADPPRTLRQDDEDDPMRTTAQLAIVLDQIEQRDDPSS